MSNSQFRDVDSGFAPPSLPSFFDGYTGGQISSAFGSTAGGGSSLSHADTVNVSLASDNTNQSSPRGDAPFIEVRQSGARANDAEQKAFTVRSGKRPVPDFNPLLQAGVPQRRNAGRPPRPRRKAESSVDESSIVDPTPAGYVTEMPESELNHWIQQAPANHSRPLSSASDQRRSSAGSTTGSGAEGYDHSFDFVPQEIALGYPGDDIFDRFPSLFPKLRDPQEAFKPQVPSARWPGMERGPRRAAPSEPQGSWNRAKCSACHEMMWNVAEGRCVSTQGSTLPRLLV